MPDPSRPASARTQNQPHEVIPRRADRAAGHHHASRPLLPRQASCIIQAAFQPRLHACLICVQTLQCQHQRGAWSRVHSTSAVSSGTLVPRVCRGLARVTSLSVAGFSAEHGEHGEQCQIGQPGKQSSSNIEGLHLDWRPAGGSKDVDGGRRSVATAQVAAVDQWPGQRLQQQGTRRSATVYLGQAYRNVLGRPTTAFSAITACTDRAAATMQEWQAGR